MSTSAMVDIPWSPKPPQKESVVNPNQRNCRIRTAPRRIGFASAIIMSAILFSSPSFALGTPEQQAACTSDVMRLCMSSLGSTSGIIACVTKNKNGLSARCKATLPPNMR
jgi:hypothetical protein